MSKFALMLFLLSLPVAAQSVKASVVRDACKQTQDDDPGHLQCSGYVSGVLDANQLWYAAIVKEKHFQLLGKFYCAPDAFRTRDAVALFVDWLARNPTFGDQPAANVIVLALREKYPCK